VPVVPLSTLPNVSVGDNLNTSTSRRGTRKSSRKIASASPDIPLRNLVTGTNRRVIRKSSRRAIRYQVVCGPSEIIEEPAVGSGSVEHMTEQVPRFSIAIKGTMSPPIAEVIDRVHRERVDGKDTLSLAAIIEKEFPPCRVIFILVMLDEGEEFLDHSAAHQMSLRVMPEGPAERAVSLFATPVGRGPGTKAKTESSRMNPGRHQLTQYTNVMHPDVADHRAVVAFDAKVFGPQIPQPCADISVFGAVGEPVESSRLDDGVRGALLESFVDIPSDSAFTFAFRFVVLINEVPDDELNIAEALKPVVIFKHIEEDTARKVQQRRAKAKVSSAERILREPTDGVSVTRP